MFRRVALIVVGIIIGLILREFGLSSKIAAVIAFVPFGLNETMNLTGPYEKTAHEIMHEEDDAATKTTGRKTGAG
jgi:hypothetical protein